MTMKPEEKHKSYNRYTLWKDYEGITMHFNELIIKLRTQSLAGVAAFATLAAIIAKGDVSPELRWGLLTGTFFMLMLFWIAIWILDFGYYNRLLQGAVNALIEIENGSCESPKTDKINLSTKIEESVENRKVKNGKVKNNCARVLFYSIVLVALFCGFSFSGYLCLKTHSSTATNITETSRNIVEGSVDSGPPQNMIQIEVGNEQAGTTDSGPPPAPPIQYSGNQ